MSRLIDANDIEWHDHHDADGNISSYKVAYSDEMPEPIDAVPVVQCKECKHSDTYAVCEEYHVFPLKCLSIRYGGVFEDWFCEHGERR